MLRNRLFSVMIYSLLLASLAIVPASRAATVATSCTDANKAVSAYVNLIQRMKVEQPDLVEALRLFPKGADIHNHLSGTIMPEDYFALGQADGDCYGPDRNDPSMFSLSAVDASGGCPSGYKALTSVGDEDRNKVLQSLSMYQYPYPDIQHGHDQFFATFSRFNVIAGMPWNVGPMLTKLLQQAHQDNVSYVETMTSFQSQAVNTLTGLLRQRYPDDASYQQSVNYPALYAYLLSVGLNDAVAGAQNDITQYVNRTNALLRCSAVDRDPACGVSYAFLAAVNRNAAKDGKPDLAKIFTQTAFSMLLASTERRVVGVNLLSGEDAAISMQSFATQMQFFTFFHAQFPSANIALHAGELTPCFVGAGNPALKDHLTGSLKAGAKRIGHGVSFASLNAADQAEVAGLMAKNNALVEIMFTSNAQILGVAGDDHPFIPYRKNGVPVAFSTDDEGVSHADYTDEWIYGFMQYRLSGNDLQQLARQSIEHSFMAGASLWSDLASGQVVSQCTNFPLGLFNPPEPCKSFLGGSAKASAQWDLETRLSMYMPTYGKFLAKYQGVAK